jgi:polysaccharide chain length determinant protein (PEP-CTERM system associated)
MRETLEMLLAEARGMWRFRWLGLTLAFILVIAGSGYVYALPDEYRAEARMSLNTQSMLDPLLEGLAVRPDVDQHVEMLTHTLLNQSNLERIARDTDLMLEANTEAQQKQLLQRLRREISIAEAGGNNIFKIHYTHEDPQRAYQVVRATLDIMMEEAIGSTQEDSSRARSFFAKKVDEYEKRLEEAERKLAEFKRENSGLLPSQEGGYYDRLNRTKEELSGFKEELTTLQSRRRTLRNELQAMRQGQGQSRTVTNPRLDRLDQQIQAATQKLNDLLLKYTESHPDVIAQREQLERLRAKREEVASEGTTRQTTSQDIESNPVYEELKIQLNETNAEIASIRPKIARREQRIDELKSKVDQITEVEAKLKSLTRNYDTTREQYQQLLSRLNSARMSSDADDTGPVDFRVIDPPTTPVDPVGPNRFLYLLVAYAFAVGAAAATGWLLSKLRPTFLDVQTLERITGRPVLGSVALVQTPMRRRLRTLEIVTYGIGLMLFGVCVGAGLLFADAGSDIVRRLIERGAL